MSGLPSVIERSRRRGRTNLVGRDAFGNRGVDEVPTATKRDAHFPSKLERFAPGPLVGLVEICCCGCITGLPPPTTRPTRPYRHGARQPASRVSCVITRWGSGSSSRAVARPLAASGMWWRSSESRPMYTNGLAPSQRVVRIAHTRAWMAELGRCRRWLTPHHGRTPFASAPWVCFTWPSGRQLRRTPRYGDSSHRWTLLFSQGRAARQSAASVRT